MNYVLASERPSFFGAATNPLSVVLAMPDGPSTYDAQHHVDAVGGAHHQEKAPVEQTLGVVALDPDGLIEDRSAEGVASGCTHRRLLTGDE
jgi:hypothetical protein